KSATVDDVLHRLTPPLSKDVIENSFKEAFNSTVRDAAPLVTKDQNEDRPVPPKPLEKPQSDTKIEENVIIAATQHVQSVSVDDKKMLCELEFGSYCLWCHEHKEEMKDSMVKQMKDRLFVARAFLPIITKLPAQQKLAREMKQNIQEFEKIFSDATTDADLPPHVDMKLQKMEEIIKKAKAFPLDCNYVDKKLRQILDLTEDEAHFHMKQSAFLYQLAVQTMPKSLHCLSMRLTVEYFRSHSLDMELLETEKFVNPELHHYVILSNNVLSSSVVINSTVMHSSESQNLVFHVITDEQNYYAMKFWYFMNSFKEATVHVLNIEDAKLGYRDKVIPLHLSLSEEYRVSLRKPSSSQMNTEYISLFGHTHFLLPEICQKLNKVVILDDDIVVQRDLSPLWSVQMEGKVNGAVQFCDVSFSQLKGYLGENRYSQSSCSWMSGLNIIDLVKWRELNLTDTYRRLLQLQNKGDVSLRVGSFPANLLTFQDLVHPLDKSWALSGLGHNYGVDAHAIEEAAVLHYNGNMKPWLELGIRKYKARWKKYLKRADQFMGECNVNP
ncbi:Hexosyltransferase, partial [Thalictrum thalictroides]